LDRSPLFLRFEAQVVPSSEVTVTRRKFVPSQATRFCSHLTRDPIRLPNGKQNELILSKAKVITLSFSVYLSDVS
jgi:hypothetical protein